MEVSLFSSILINRFHCTEHILVNVPVTIYKSIHVSISLKSEIKTDNRHLIYIYMYTVLLTTESYTLANAAMVDTLYMACSVKQ